MPGWSNYRSLVAEEFKQAEEEGREVGPLMELKKEFDLLGNEEEKLKNLWSRILSVPMRQDYPFEEPSDLVSIKAARKITYVAPPLKLSDEVLLDRLKGAWLGRSCGCALGKPVENYMGFHEGISSKQRIKEFLLAVSPEEFPLNFYFPSRSPAEAKVGPLYWGWLALSTRENIQFMESDDDIRYTVIGQKILLEKGYGFTTLDVAEAWLKWLPYKSVCTAETQAYRNLVAKKTHTATSENENLDLDWVASHENPYREWIGADIRIDSYGYACPGNPELAAELAWRDARLSHVKNGIYGSMLFAAMIAAAFVTDDVHEIVEAGLSQIPEKSRLYVEMRQVIEICKKYQNQYQNFEKVHDEIYTLLGHYHAVHTNNNAALVISALLLGQHDFEKVITTAVMGGWDTDCTGATAGSIFGVMVGSKALPAKWTSPLNNTLKSDMIDYHPISFDECARLSHQIIKNCLSKA